MGSVIYQSFYTKHRDICLFLEEGNIVALVVYIQARPRSHGHFFSGKVGLSRKISSCKLNSVAKFLCQISVTKLSELSSISNLCCL